MSAQSTSQVADREAPFEAGYGRAIFDHDRPEESERLALIEEEQDPYTTARIDALGIAPDWHCLEIGAGKGSMAVWLADRCPRGRVVAVDLDVGMVDVQGRSNIDVRQMDISNETFAADSFDLIHARAVLTHLPNAQDICNRMARWLRPGGWLFLADPASFPVDSSPHPLMRKIGAASTAAMSQMVGTDPYWARSYPTPLVRAGLVDVDAECRLRLMQGGAREAKMFELMLAQMEQPMIATGLVAAEEVALVRRQLLDPAFFDFPPAFVRAWGRRPQAATALE
jgi:SAM-dependent methyltransferase